MATKKTVSKVESEEQEQLLEQPAEEEQAETVVKSEWDEEMSMVVPRKPKGEENFYYVCVNDRRYQVPADGKVQKLPKPIAEILRDALQAENEADDFADHIPNKTGPGDAVI